MKTTHFRNVSGRIDKIDITAERLNYEYFSCPLRGAGHYPYNEMICIRKSPNI